MAFEFRDRECRQEAPSGPMILSHYAYSLTHRLKRGQLRRENRYISSNRDCNRVYHSVGAVLFIIPIGASGTRAGSG